MIAAAAAVRDRVNDKYKPLHLAPVLALTAAAVVADIH